MFLGLQARQACGMNAIALLNTDVLLQSVTQISTGTSAKDPYRGLPLHFLP